MEGALASLSPLQQGPACQCHTAVVENKRLSHAPTIIKAQQDLRNEPKIKTSSEKIGYKKNPRQLMGRITKRKSRQCPRWK